MVQEITRTGAPQKQTRKPTQHIYHKSSQNKGFYQESTKTDVNTEVFILFKEIRIPGQGQRQVENTGEQDNEGAGLRWG